jgi:hypothetical protein
MAPDGLAIRRQLAARGLTPGRQPIAAQVMWLRRRTERAAYLYRIDRARTDVARALEHTVRFLNYAAMPGKDFPGLAGPPDVYALLGPLTEATYALTQLARQLGDYLAAGLAAGQIAVTYGSSEADPVGATADACAGLHAAGAAAAQLHAGLNQAWMATAGMVTATNPGHDHDDQDHAGDHDHHGGDGDAAGAEGGG